MPHISDILKYKNLIEHLEITVGNIRNIYGTVYGDNLEISGTYMEQYMGIIWKYQEYGTVNRDNLEISGTHGTVYLELSGTYMEIIWKYQEYGTVNRDNLKISGTHGTFYGANLEISGTH